MPCIHDDEEFLHRLKQFIYEAVQNALTSDSQPKPPVYAQDQLLTEKQVSKLMSCSVRTLQAWRKRTGKGPRPTMVGTLARYRFSDVLTYIDKGGQ